jgi:adenylate cyclase class IV
MTYEVERRAPGHMELPGRPELISAGTIQDSYFSLFPQLRLRVIDLSYPRSERCYWWTRKTREGLEMREEETPIKALDYSKLFERFSRIHGNPMLVLSCYREMSQHGALTICHDTVDGLGPWTEAEKLVASHDEIQKAVGEIYEFFRSLGVSDDRIAAETYPELMTRRMGMC